MLEILSIKVESTVLARDERGRAMSAGNRDYYLERSQQEREAARKSTDPVVAAIHDQLADEYLTLANTDSWGRPRIKKNRATDTGSGDADNYRQIQQPGPA